MESGRKHALLAYRIRYRRQRGLYFVVALAVLALYAASRLLPPETWVNVPWVQQLDWLLLLTGIIVLVIAVFRIIAGAIRRWPGLAWGPSFGWVDAWAARPPHRSPPRCIFGACEKHGLTLYSMCLKRAGCRAESASSC